MEGRNPFFHCVEVFCTSVILIVYKIPFSSFFPPEIFNTGLMGSHWHLWLSEKNTWAKNFFFFAYTWYNLAKLISAYFLSENIFLDNYIRNV